MRRLFYLLLASIAVLAIGCSKDSEPDSLIINGVTEVGKTPEIDFTPDGGVSAIDIQSNTVWAITPDGQDWYELSALSGEGNAKVNITVKSNRGDIERSARLNLVAGSAMATIAIIQKSQTLPSDPQQIEIKVRAYGGENAIEIIKGVDFSVEVPQSADWIKEASVNNEAGTVSFVFAENGTDEYREADVKVITSASKKDLGTVHISQSWRNIEPGELLIEEIFFTGNALPDTGKPEKRNGDQYYKLTNNTDETLYADGVMIMESKINSVLTYEYVEPIKESYTGIQTAYCIPGTGKDVPVKPGASIIICNNAQNHTVDNPNSFDLSKADFEWYDQSTSSANQDIDNPAVPNLDIWYTYTLSYWIMHNRGYTGHAIAVFPKSVTKEKFLADYKWEGQYINHTKVGDFTMNISKAYKIPNEWVLDAVNLSLKQLFYSLEFGEKLDAGYASCGEIDMDPNRYGKSVRRKTDTNGKLVDTNNSTNDFISDAVPSLKK